MPRLRFCSGILWLPGLDYMQGYDEQRLGWNTMLGVKLSWNFRGLLYLNNLDKLRIASRQQVEVQRDVFIQYEFQAARENRDIARLHQGDCR